MAATSDLDACVAAVLAGDQGAYRPVVDRCLPRLRAQAAVILPDRAELDECVQEACVAGYRRLGEYRPGGDLAQRLAALALAEAQERRRAWLRRVGALRVYRSELEGALDAELTSRAEQAPAALAALRDSLGTLPDDARGVIEEHHRRGRSLSSIARTLERSDAWVRIVLFRGCETLAAGIGRASTPQAGAAASQVDAGRLDHLLATWLADGLTDAEGRELADLARRDPAVRTRLADLALVNRLLPETAASPSGATADAVLARLRATGALARAETVTDADRPAGLRASRLPARPAHEPLLLGAIAAAVVIAVLAAVLIWW